MYDWGKKRKMLVFTGVYVCVKAKLTFVSFFFQFFFSAPFPKHTFPFDITEICVLLDYFYNFGHLVENFVDFQQFQQN